MMFEDFYGLTERPFQLTPDPKFYFESGTHRKALSYLGYGLTQGEGFIVITGEVGSGKSTLVTHLTATIDPAQLTVGQLVTSALDGDEIVHVVAQNFDLDIAGRDKASALGAIEAFLHDEARAGRRCLLVVDESQNLGIAALEELRMLSNFQLGAHPLLQTLLLGQPEFRATLQTHPELEQLRQRVIAAHHLAAMDASEIQPYVEHRLRCAGWDGNPAFDQRVFGDLFAATDGIPRRINQVTTRLLLLGAVEHRKRIDAAMLQTVLAEMESDTALPAAVPEPTRHLDPASQEKRTATTGATFDAELVASALAERDAQIAELQDAVIELAQAVENIEAKAPSREDSFALEQRIEALEGQLDEQDRTLRHTLTMLIETIESESGHSLAA